MGKQGSKEPPDLLVALEKHPSSTADSHEFKSYVAPPPGLGPNFSAEYSVISSFPSAPGTDRGAASLHASDDRKAERRQPACEMDQVRSVRRQADLSEQGSGVDLPAGSDYRSWPDSVLECLGDECSFADSAIRNGFRICHSGADAERSRPSGSDRLWTQPCDAADYGAPGPSHGRAGEPVDHAAHAGSAEPGNDGQDLARVK